MFCTSIRYTTLSAVLVSDRLPYAFKTFSALLGHVLWFFTVWAAMFSRKCFAMKSIEPANATLPVKRDERGLDQRMSN